MAKQKILFIGDTLSSLNLKTDTSIAFCEAALKMNFDVFWCEIKDVSFYNFQILINQASLIKKASTEILQYNEFFDQGKKSIEFAKFDYCFVRSNPPFDKHYLDLCWILNTQTKVKIINSPAALLNFHEKSFHLRAFAEGVLKQENMIPTCFTDSLNVVKNFLETHTKNNVNEFVTKPWLGFGGSEIKLWKNTNDLFAYIQNASEKLLIQPFLENIKTDGDRRVFIVNGKVVCSFVRIPPKESIISNTASGGTPILREMTPEQIFLCDKIAQFTLKHGVVLAGMDLIGDKVGEINITSPTGFRLWEKLTNSNIVEDVFKILIH